VIKKLRGFALNIMIPIFSWSMTKNSYFSYLSGFGLEPTSASSSKLVLSLAVNVAFIGPDAFVYRGEMDSEESLTKTSYTQQPTKQNTRKTTKGRDRLIKRPLRPAESRKWR